MSWRQNAQVVKYPIPFQKNAEIDCKNKAGMTPLTLASNEQHLDLVELLLNKGANIEVQKMLKYLISFLPAAKPAGLCFANVIVVLDLVASSCSCQGGHDNKVN